MELAQNEKENKKTTNASAKSPLVSIIVVTYNSAKFVLETLESSKVQTYRNIELIITDDCSTDNTVEICRRWIDENGKRFVRAELIENKKNTGIIENSNRGLHAAQGEWLKFIAGDDILLDTCIIELIGYCSRQGECKILFGRLYWLVNNNIRPTIREKIATADSSQQKKLIYKGTPGPELPAPAAFLHKSTLLTLGGFDADYQVMEDLPLWAKYVDNNVRLHFLDKYIAIYRIHENNISGNRSKKYTNRRLYLDIKKYIKTVLIPYCLNKRYYGMLLHHLNYILIFELIFLLGNKNNWVSKMLSILILYKTVEKIEYRLKERLDKSIKYQAIISPRA